MTRDLRNFRSRKGKLELHYSLIRTPTEIKTPNITAYLTSADRDRHRKLKESVEEEKKKLPPELDRAMVVSDISKPITPAVFIRGQAGRRGKNVPRRFIEILSDEKRKPYTKGAGRYEMAQQITDPQNPLTSRVLANRIWMQLMGKSLVATPSDFGTRCPEPLQRDVLDYMAAHLIENDWSIKSLQRTILMSRCFGSRATIANLPLMSTNQIHSSGSTIGNGLNSNLFAIPCFTFQKSSISKWEASRSRSPKDLLQNAEPFMVTLIARTFPIC